MQIYMIAAAAALLAATPAIAADNAAIDVGELTCAQFTGYNNDNRGLIMMWFEGYYPRKTRPRPSISARWRATSPSS